MMPPGGPMYRTFWRRLGAAILDALVLTPFWLILEWLSPADGGVGFLGLWVLSNALGIAYSILLHARYGQTLGKRATGVLVLDVNGGNLTMRQAVLRDLPNIILSLVWIGLATPAILAGRDPFATDGGSMTLAQAIEAAITYGWFALELLTMLTNEKRRSVHDFIAGSVVVRQDLRHTA